MSKLSREKKAERSSAKPISGQTGGVSPFPPGRGGWSRAPGGPARSSTRQAAPPEAPWAAGAGGSPAAVSRVHDPDGRSVATVRRRQCYVITIVKAAEWMMEANLFQRAVMSFHVEKTLRAP